MDKEYIAAKLKEILDLNPGVNVAMHEYLLALSLGARIVGVVPPNVEKLQKALFACLYALRSMGCEGPVEEAIKALEE